MKYQIRYQTLKLADLVHPPYNPRVQIERDTPEYDALKRSLEQHELVEPLVVNLCNMHCVGGNQRLTVMRDMGVEEETCVVIEQPDELKEKELCLALNKIKGRWDTEKTGELLRDDAVLDFETGFDLDEVKSYRAIEEATATEHDATFPLRLDSYSGGTERIRRIFDRIRADLVESGDDDAVREEIYRLSSDTSTWNLEQWRKVVKQTLGINIRQDYFMGGSYEQMCQRWAAENVSKIKSISDTALDEMQDIVLDGFINGKSNRDIAREIQGRYDVSKSKARFLATDQIGTLNAQLNQTRQRSAGVRRYEWSSSGDERVRECHQELDGNVFSYDDPPEMWYMTKHGIVYTGRRCNPGEDYGCRCVALPIFDEDEIEPSAFED